MSCSLCYPNKSHVPFESSLSITRYSWKSPPGLLSSILPIILKLWGVSAFPSYEILLLLVTSQTMNLVHCEIQDKRGSCTDLQLGSLLFCGAPYFQVTLLNKCIWLPGSRKHYPYTNNLHVIRRSGCGRIYVCTGCARNSCPWLIWFFFLHWFLANLGWSQCCEVYSHT